MLTRIAQRARTAARTAADAVRSVVTPAALVRDHAPVTVPDPADVYTDDEMPTAEEIDAAADAYTTACDEARAADRGKRRAKKTLGRLPAGLYGRWLIERVPSSRMTPDLEAIRAAYQRHGLGDVPMRPCAPSLRLTDTTPAALPAPVDTALVAA